MAPELGKQTSAGTLDLLMKMQKRNDPDAARAGAGRAGGAHRRRGRAVYQPLAATVKKDPYASPETRRIVYASADVKELVPLMKDPDARSSGVQGAPARAAPRRGDGLAGRLVRSPAARDLDRRASAPGWPIRPRTPPASSAAVADPADDDARAGRPSSRCSIRSTLGCSSARRRPHAQRPATLDDLPDESVRSRRRARVRLDLDAGRLADGPGRSAGRTRAASLADLRHDLPDLHDADVVGSPFAIVGYDVHRDFGGDPALARLRERLQPPRAPPAGRLHPQPRRARSPLASTRIRSSSSKETRTISVASRRTTSRCRRRRGGGSSRTAAIRTSRAGTTRFSSTTGTRASARR